MRRPRRSARHPGAQFVTHAHRNRVVSPRIAPTLKRRSPPCRNWQSRLDWHWRRPRPMRKTPSSDNRRRRPLPARVAYGRSYLMDECEVMAYGRERSPTIITPVLAPSSCLLKQASLDASGDSAPRLLSFHFFMGSVSAPGRGRSPRSETKKPAAVGGPSSDCQLGQRETLERAKGLEPSTPTLARSCSTTELHPHPRWRRLLAGNGRPMPNALGECNTRARSKRDEIARFP